MSKNKDTEKQLLMFADDVEPNVADTHHNKTSSSHKLLSIKLEGLRSLPNQPRQFIDQEELIGLSDSIKAHGILQPIVVQKDKDGYSIVIGHRRVLAASLAGLETIPAIVTNGNPLELSLLENLQRCNLTAVEEGESLAKFKEMTGCTLDQMSAIFCKAKSTLSEIISLKNLPTEIKDECRVDAYIPKGILVHIARKQTAKEMILAYRAYRSKGLDRGDVRNLQRSNTPSIKQLVGSLTFLNKRLSTVELEQLKKLKGKQREKIRNNLENIDNAVKIMLSILDS